MITPVYSGLYIAHGIGLSAAGHLGARPYNSSLAGRPAGDRPASAARLE